MKFFIILSIISISVGVKAQENQFFDAMRTGSITGISQYLDNKVEVSIIDDHNMYTRNQAVQKINYWLNKSNPSSVQNLHGGESNDNSSFYHVAKLTTKSGHYRVFVYFERGGNSAIIKKIQIDPF